MSSYHAAANNTHHLTDCAFYLTDRCTKVRSTLEPHRLALPRDGRLFIHPTAISLCLPIQPTHPSTPFTHRALPAPSATTNRPSATPGPAPPGQAAVRLPPNPTHPPNPHPPTHPHIQPTHPINPPTHPINPPTHLPIPRQLQSRVFLPPPRQHGTRSAPRTTRRRKRRRRRKRWRRRRKRRKRKWSRRGEE